GRGWEYYDPPQTLRTERLNYVVFRHDVIIATVILSENRAVFACDQIAQPLQRRVETNHRIWLFQHFMDLFSLQIGGSGHHPRKETAFADGADQFARLQDRQVFDMVFLHELERFVDRLVRGGCDQPFGAATGNDVFERLDIHESALHHPLVIVDLADIPAAVVVEDDHDEIALFQQVLQLHEALDSSPRAVSAKQALFARDATRHEGGILVGHLFEDVDDAHVIVLRYEILPDALRYIRVHFIHIDLAGPEIFGQQRPILVHGPDLDGGILFLEVHGCSGDGAAGTRGDNQVRHFAVGLLPDLGPRSFIVREPVGEVIVLI